MLKLPAQVQYSKLDTIKSQNTLDSLMAQYAGYNRQQSSAKEFIGRLQTDSTLLVDTLIAHNNNSRFYIRGYHKRFNPFGLSLDSIKVIVSEHYMSVPYSKHKDTILLVQVEGIATGQKRISQLPLFFDQFAKAVQPAFFKTQFFNNSKRKRQPGQAAHFYITETLRPALNATWCVIREDTASLCLTFLMDVSFKE